MISLYYFTCATLLAKTNRDLHDICHSDHAVGLKSPCSYSLCCVFHHPLHCYPHSSYSNSESITTCNCKSSWISWHFLQWELQGITSPCCPLIGQYPHHTTFCPLQFLCYAIHLHVDNVHASMFYRLTSFCG